ncbi:hypothetical protein C5Z26_02255 [Lactobacillus sp. CBA3606]|uniref:YfhO family protein n=1 Tax=Lactobacillus sp. CBA3606 TaxID=2099789 RepID=UPI000CFB58E2|nr:YfhO family protein [Lactobacillus sp. CBA3606]AVK63016.1 hypothetical protein C5Z26_02255 [Lactobacillus sp. CBA3606]
MQKNVPRVWTVPLTAGILALIIVSTILWQQQITPFGDHNLLISDMGTQYLSFFTTYRHALLNHNFQLYSFSQSLGGSMVPTIAYYLMSPFNLIILAFPAAQLPTGITIIIMVKISAIAITTTHFLQTHYRTNRRSAALFGLAFSLCGFVALNYFDLMWLDALIWLPLILKGLDQLLATGHAARFFWWLWVSIVTDFYLGYMTCLFVGFYLVYQLALTKTTSFWQTVYQRRYRLLQLLMTGLLSVVSALFLLIPTALGMLQTAKTTQTSTNFLPLPQFGLEVFSQLGLGANNYAQRLAHAPTIFCTTFVILLVMTYFVHPKITKRRRRAAGFLLLALLLSMLIQLFNTIWHLFQQPAGFPFRNAFFFSFVLIMLAYEAWLAGPRQIPHRWQWRLPSLLTAGLIIGWLTNYGLKQPLASSTLALSLGYVWLTTAAIFLVKRRQALLITGIVLTELGGNLLLSMQTTSFGSQAIYQTAYTTEAKQMQKVSDPDGQLYRVNNTNTLINHAYREKYNNYNDPLLFNFHGINYYSSTLNEQSRLTLQNLGLYSRNARRINSEGLTPVSAMLLGIKYNVFLRHNGRAQTELNPNYLGMGFVIPAQLTQVTLTPNHALANQEQILQNIQASISPYYMATSFKQNSVTASGHHYQHRLQLKINASGPLYYSDPHQGTRYSTFKVNGQPITPSVNADYQSLLWPLGTYRRGQTVTLQFETNNRHLTTSQQLASLDRTTFKAAYDTLKSSAFIPKYHAHGLTTTVTGHVNNRSNKHWLYVAIPYDTAWQATVNDQPVNTKKIIGGLTALPVKAGQNKIQLQYHVPALKFSSVLSLLGFLTFGLWTGVQHYRSKQRQLDQQQFKHYRVH